MYAECLVTDDVLAKDMEVSRLATKFYDAHLVIRIILVV
jgi:hypothetical protein